MIFYLRKQRTALKLEIIQGLIAVPWMSSLGADRGGVRPLSVQEARNLDWKGFVNVHVARPRVETTFAFMPPSPVK